MPKSQTKYIDAYVLVVPKDKVAQYKKVAKQGGDLWIKHGALAYKECMGDDLSPDMGGFPYLQFPKMAKAKPDETVWYSFIEYKSKAHRDQVNKKVMKEMEKQHKDKPDHMDDMPFDSKRMAYGGFKVVVSC